jgi:RNA polymerase sigma-70 factor (ECF subfamily)
LQDADDDINNPQTIERWVLDARRGSQAAHAQLYRRFAPLVHGILLGRVRPALADELTQECFTLALGRLAQLREPRKFGAWIAMIARRMPSGAASFEVATDDAADFAASDATPEQRAEAMGVLRAIVGLPEAYRETLMLRLVEGLNGPEIAALTGLTPDSVRVNLHRGMEKLRAALGADKAHGGSA